MATDITPEFGCAVTGEWSIGPYQITFRLADGDYTIEFDHKVDTIETVIEKLSKSKRVEVELSPHVSLDNWTLPDS
jgi:hypothetical protein